MHELMLDCLYLFAILLSVLGCTMVVLALIEAVKGIIDIIEHDDE